MEEGTDQRIPDREFGLVVGEPAEFRFFCSAVRKNDQTGALIEDFGDDLRRTVAHGSEPASRRERRPSVVPVSFETVVTETGMLQLWCVARDGRRWKLEFNVRERVARMKIGIDLGTTNSALAYIDPREAEDHELSADPHFRNAATGGARPSRAAAHAAVVSVPRRRPARRRRTRASRARWCPRKLVHSAKSWLSNPGRGPHRENPAVGLAGDGRACSRRWKCRRGSCAKIPRSLGQRDRRRRWPSRTSSSPCPRPSTKRRAS